MEVTSGRCEMVPVSELVPKLVSDRYCRHG